jgi:hypothetical protein
MQSCRHSHNSADQQESFLEERFSLRATAVGPSVLPGISRTYHSAAFSPGVSKIQEFVKRKENAMKCSDNHYVSTVMNFTISPPKKSTSLLYSKC